MYSRMPRNKKARTGRASWVFCRLSETGLDSYLVGRGNLKQVGIYLFFQINNLLVNLPGIPVGTLRDLDSDGRCFLSSAQKTNWDRVYQANGRAVDCCPCAYDVPTRRCRGS